MAGVLGCGADDDKTNVPPGLGPLATNKRSGPEGTVFRLWRMIQVRSYQVAALEYDERVLDALGTDTVIGALEMQQMSLAVTAPKVIAADRTPLGVLVIVNAMSKGRPVGRYSFLLGRKGGSWKLRYDTLLGDTLPAYVQQRVQRRIDPNADQPSQRAAAAGQRAAKTYRDLFAPAAHSRQGVDTDRRSAKTRGESRPRQPPSRRPAGPPER
jgi:hypothetical protein